MEEYKMNNNLTWMNGWSVNPDIVLYWKNKRLTAAKQNINNIKSLLDSSDIPEKLLSKIEYYA